MSGAATGSPRGSDAPSGAGAGASWAAATTALQEQHDVLLLDLDGVVYVGDHAVDGARESLAQARRAGARLAFVTNNAARTAGSVAEHLTGLGVEARADDVVTSAQAAATLLAGRLAAGSRVLVVGGEGLHEAITGVELQPVLSADHDPAAVVQGFAPQVGWQMLLEACVAVRAGALWVATNPDLTLPTPRGLAPGNGALVDVVRRTTGSEPLVAGKPFRPIMDEAVRRTAAKHPLVVGDRLDTDIAGAVTAGLPSLLVLTGVSRVHELLAAPVGSRPTYLGSDLGSLRRPHPGCEPVAGGWRCGQVTALGDGGRVELTPATPVTGSVDEALAAVRAVCSAVWSSSGRLDPHQGATAVAAWTAPHGWDR